MSWIFLLGVGALCLGLAALFKSNPRHIGPGLFVMSISLYFQDPFLYAAPISWQHWPGPVKGLEVSVVDAFALAILYATKGPKVPAALKFGLALYVAGFLISSFQAVHIEPTIFYGWQLLRAVILFLAVFNVAATNSKYLIAIAGGLAAGLFFEAAYVALQYARGVAEPGGTLGHRNMLGLSSHFAVMPMFALLLAAQRQKLALLTAGSGLCVALLGGSRATIGFYAIGLAAVAFLSLWQKPTGRKMGFAVVAALALVLAAPAMNWALQRRADSAAVGSTYERNAMTLAAKMIIADHPMGVGANQYVIIAATRGYSARAGVAWVESSRGAPVHNSYLLVTAELGFLGLAGFLTVLAYTFTAALRNLRRFKGQGEPSALLVGYLGTGIAVAGHLAYEWLFASFLFHYLLAITLAAILGTLKARQSSPVNLVGRMQGSGTMSRISASVTA